MPKNGIMIELSKAQIGRVLRKAAENDALLGGLGGPEDVKFRVSQAQLNDPGLSSSLLRGLTVLASFPADGVGRSVRDVARELDMSSSATHRYVSTLLEIGLLKCDPVSHEYRRAVRG
jgi:IclR helix-turn-helix domain